IGERYAADKVAHDKDCVAVAAHLMDGYDVRVSELSGGASFAKKLLRFLTRQLAFARNFYRYGAIELCITIFPNRAESAYAKQRHELKSANFFQRWCLASLLFSVDETKSTAAGSTSDTLKWSIGHQFDRVAAVWTANVQTA